MLVKRFRLFSFGLSNGCNELRGLYCCERGVEKYFGPLADARGSVVGTAQIAAAERNSELSGSTGGESMGAFTNKLKHVLQPGVRINSPDASQ